MIKKFIFNEKVKKISVYLILFFLSFYIFSVTAFDEIYGLHYINYFAISFLAIAVLFYDIIYLKKIFVSRYMIFPILFVVYAAIITLINQTNFAKIVTISITLLSFIFLYQAVKIINNVSLVYKSLFFAAAAYLIFFVCMNFEEIISLDFLNKRIGGNLGNENTVGINLLMYSLIFIVAALNKKRWYILFGAIPFLFLSLFTGSKKVFFGFFILCLVVLFTIFKNRKILFLISILVLFLFGFLIIQLPFFSATRERLFEMFVSIFTGTGDASTETRELFSKIGMYLGGKNMFFGLGADGFAYNTNFGTYSHNNFVEIFCDFGFVGSLLFYVPIVSILLKIKYNYNAKIYFFAFLMILFLFIMGIAMVFYYSKILPIFYAIAFGTSKEFIIKVKRKINV